MRVEGSREFTRSIRGLNPNSFLDVSVKLEAYAVDVEEKWTDEERDEFLEKARAACREICDFLETQFKLHVEENTKHK